jgi:hypothetical protein
MPKISQLESATDVTANDFIQIIDVEDSGMAPSGTNKKVTASLLAKELAKQPLEPGIVISGSSSGDAVRITQTGSGNALVVEDSANPDATPFVINSSGQLFIGKLSEPGARTIDIVSNGGAADANNGNIRSIRSADEVTGIIYSQGRTRGSAQTPTIVQANDSLGSFVFTGYDGADQIVAARISSGVDGTPGVSDMPGRLEFSTTSDGSSTPLERMRITNSGNVGIGTISPSASCLLHLTSTTSGFRPPSMTTAQRDLIATPIAGVMIYNNSTNKLNFYNGSAWEAVTSSV